MVEIALMECVSSLYLSSRKSGIEIARSFSVNLLSLFAIKHQLNNVPRAQETAVHIALMPNKKALPGNARTSQPLISDACADIATGHVPSFLPAIRKSSRVLLNLEDQSPIKTSIIKYIIKASIKAFNCFSSPF